MSLFCSKTQDELKGKRIILFSYGSGLASAMFSLRISTDLGQVYTLSSLLYNVSDITKRLASRTVIPPQEFEQIMKLREETHHKAPYVPQGNQADLFPGTFYLSSVDEKHRRTYNQVPSIKEEDMIAANVN